MKCANLMALSLEPPLATKAENSQKSGKVLMPNY